MSDAALILQPEFQEAHRAHERQQRINTGKVASALVVFLMPAGVVLDYFVYWEQLVPFFWIRLFGSGLGAVLWWLHTTSFGQRNVRWLGLPIALAPAFCVAWMIYRTEGAGSPYYAGLNLVLLAVSAVVRWSFVESLLAVAAISLMYFVCCAAQPGPITNWKGFGNNIYFLVLTGIIVVTGNYLFNRLRFREFRLTFELERNKQALEESNRKLTELDQIKGRFFANISHELRTPLTLMISPLESILARWRSTLDPAAIGLLQTMHSNGLRLLKLINDLLDLVRLDSGVMQVRREPVALEQFLQGMAAAAKQVAEDKKINLVIAIAPDVGTVMVDRDKLEKIILNLQFNALKFTPSGGRVELRADKEGEELVLRVSDTGIGIPAKDLPSVFGRFFQVDSSSRRKYQGVGIGLALVKELTELHGGTITVESVEGQGTTFTARMPFIAADAAAVIAPVTPAQSLPTASQPQPVADDAAAPPAATVSSQEWLSNLYHRANLFGGIAVDKATPARSPSSPVKNGHSATVLIADDQPDMLRFLQSELAPHYHVVPVTDGQQAVDKAAEIVPDIILLDMMMPEKDGMQACREIRAAPATHNVPIVLVTAHVDEETKLNALRAGASDFLPKPFSTTELHVRVKNLVESHEFQRQLARQNRTLEITIDQLKATESQLVQSEKLASLGRMSAGIIHEINNPLNFATTGIFTLRNKGRHLAPDQREDFAEVLRDVEEGLSRVKTIVTDLRGFTHPDMSDVDEVPVADIVSAALRFLSHEWRDQVIVQTQFTDGQTVRGNRNKLTQVLVNLVQNSVDALREKAFAAGEKPTITITGSVEDGKNILRVRDNGPGITPENEGRVFDPFFTTKDVGQGMGLGLSICYRIMHDCQGRISVKSEPGQSCEFTLEFPLLNPAPAVGA